MKEENVLLVFGCIAHILYILFFCVCIVHRWKRTDGNEQDRPLICGEEVLKEGANKREKNGLGSKCLTSSISFLMAILTSKDMMIVIKAVCAFLLLLLGRQVCLCSVHHAYVTLMPQHTARVINSPSLLFT